MTYLYYTLGFLVLLIITILAIGAMQPIKHTASRTITLNAPTAQVWSLLTQYADMPNWRKELLKVTKAANNVTNNNDNEVWQEFENEKESLDFETIEQIENQRLVRKIVGNRTDFGGTWTFVLAANGDKTQLTITENGEVYNILFRFVSKFIMGHYASIDKFLKQLEAAI